MQQSYGQNNNNIKTFKGDKFSIEYSSLWQMESENTVLNIFPKENFGAVTISSRSGINFPLEKTKDFILEMNEIKDNPEKVKMIMKNGIAEFYYEHTDKDLQWVTKVFRKGNDFYLLTVNCELNKWNENKKQFIAVMNSFRLY